LKYESVPTDALQRLEVSMLGDLSDACLVLTAGTTAVGAVDPLDLAGAAAWTHVDAAWAGPLRLCERYRERLAGMEKADSIAVSAHKWLFQPKESGFVFFRDVVRANEAISYRGGYLAVPNIGLLGSHGAAAIPLLGMLMAWGRSGVAEQIETCMAKAACLADAIERSTGFELFAAPETGIVVFRPQALDSFDSLSKRLLPATASVTHIKDASWFRCVPANPAVQIDRVLEKIGVR